MTVMFNVASDGSFFFVPSFVWRSKGPRDFKSYKDPLKPMSVHYFSSKKSWMDSGIMESILSRPESKMCLEKRQVVLFWDKATCFPETFQKSLTNIKHFFLPKNTTERLQPLDPDIIWNFKHKYTKLFVCYVDSRMDEGKTDSQITEDVNVLKAITWL